MPLHDPTDFLADSADVIDDWEGSVDAASWSADGSHEPARLHGYYYGYDEAGSSYQPVQWPTLGYTTDGVTFNYEVQVAQIQWYTAAFARLATASAAAVERFELMSAQLRGITTSLSIYDEWYAPDDLEPLLPAQLWDRAVVQTQGGYNPMQLAQQHQWSVAAADALEQYRHPQLRPRANLPYVALPDSVVRAALDLSQRAPAQIEAQAVAAPSAGVAAQRSPYPTGKRPPRAGRAL